MGLRTLWKRVQTIDILPRARIIPPNTLKDFEEDEYASYGGQRTGCSWWKSCPHDGAEWTSELQSETIAGYYSGERNSASRDTPVTGLGYNSSGRICWSVPETSEAGYIPVHHYRDFLLTAA